MRRPFRAEQYTHLPLNDRIRYRGRDEQEDKFLFPGLYGGAPATRNERGHWKHLERHLSKVAGKAFRFH